MGVVLAPDAVPEIVAACLRAAGGAASIGALGAIAEYGRAPGDSLHADGHAEDGAYSQIVDGGALRVRPSPGPATAVAFEGLTARPDGWTQEVALCLPADAARMAGRTALTELGPDPEPIRTGDAGMVLFDMGLGLQAIDALIRTDDEALIDTLRGFEGRALLGDGAEAMVAIKSASPHRVFVSPFARVEVYQRIGSTARGIPTPDGAHTHVIPGLLSTGRSHNANAPIPHRQVPCLSLYPPHAVPAEAGGESYSVARFRAAQGWIERYADPDYVATKRRVLEALGAGQEPESFAAPDTRLTRLAVRVALRQAAAAGIDENRLAPWRARFDRGARRETEPAHPH